MDRNFTHERLAIYSIVNSLTELPEITTVDFWIEGAPLEKLTFMELQTGLERNERLFASSGSSLQDATIYASCDGETLVALPQMLTVQEDVDFNEALMNALIDFSGEDGAVGCIPSGTKLLSLRMEGTACILDLTGEFLAENLTAQDEELAVRSIVATMCSIEGITSVEILVEGLEPNYQNADLKNIRDPETHWFAEN